MSEHPKACLVSQRLISGKQRDRWLMVICAGSEISTRELPRAKEIDIGQADSCHVRIDHPSISRMHLRLVLGSRVEAIDLGSSNGTLIGGRKLEPRVPATVQPGDVIQAGSITLVLQRLSRMVPRNILTHDYFEARLDEECARCKRQGSTFCVLQVWVGRHANRERVESVLHRALRSQDVIAQFAPGEYEVMVSVGESGTGVILPRLEDGFRSEGIDSRIGVARYPIHGTESSKLIAYARAVIHGVASHHGPSLRSALAGRNELATRVAKSNITVLLLGETGVGKEVMAEAIHRMSPRAKKTFLRLNCATFSESLFESELFGHARGAFTGAVSAKVGLLESAAGGTVFLDEIGELPMNLQAKLLRVVEERRVTPVGSLASRPLDVRFIAATNRDLETEILRGLFRKDLFFRLGAVTIVVPPLRERTHEIEEFAHLFASRALRGPGITPEFTPEALAVLCSYGWPGNIRELKNVIERAVLLSDGRGIDLEHLPLERMRATRTAFPTPNPGESSDSVPPSGRWSSPVDLAMTARLPVSLRDDLQSIERQRIMDALDQTNGNQSRAAILLGISRGTLIKRIKQYEIPIPRKL